jgi:hypothetical protein
LLYALSISLLYRYEQNFFKFNNENLKQNAGVAIKAMKALECLTYLEQAHVEEELEDSKDGNVEVDVQRYSA